MNAAEDQPKQSVFSRDKKSGRITLMSREGFTRHARQISPRGMSNDRSPPSGLVFRKNASEIRFARQPRDTRDKCIRVLSRLSLLPLGERHARHEHLAVAVVNKFANGDADGDER